MSGQLRLWRGELCVLAVVLCRVLNRRSGPASFGARHRRPGRMNTLFALGRPGPRLESLGLVQGDWRAQADVDGDRVYMIPAGKKEFRPASGNSDCLAGDNSASSDPVSILTLLFRFVSMGEYRRLVFPIALRPCSIKLIIYVTVRPYRVVVLNFEALGLKRAWILSRKIAVWDRA